MTVRTYIRTDRNGTKYYRCRDFNLTWTEQVRTPEYEAKLQARREARRQKELEGYSPEYRAMVEEQRRVEKEAERQRIAERKAILEELAAKRLVSKHVGTEGQRENFTVTFEDVFYIYTRFGEMRIYRFADKDKNVLVWKTTSRVETPLNKGQQYNITAFVKEHAEYKNEKQTVINRVAFN